MMQKWTFFMKSELFRQIFIGVHSGPDPLKTIFVKIEKSLKNLQNALKSYNTPEFCA